MRPLIYIFIHLPIHLLAGFEHGELMVMSTLNIHKYTHLLFIHSFTYSFIIQGSNLAGEPLVHDADVNIKHASMHFLLIN